MAIQTEKRKADHVNIVLKKGVESHKTNSLEQVEFVHYALPEMDYAKINTGTNFLGRKLKAPLMITGMTGGYKEAAKINSEMAAACDEKGVVFGLGSQRAMVEDPGLARTFNVRKAAPNVFLCGNIGAYQLKVYAPKQIEGMLSAVEADALCVHLNPLQEAVQPEGDKNWEGCLNAIERISSYLKIPVIAKEVGFGINREVAEELKAAGVKAIDVSGMGGTSWAAIELYRKGAKAGEAYWDWGLTTLEALLDCKGIGLPLIASGGIRSGLEVAKCVRLGATLGGGASPFIKAQNSGGEKAVAGEIQKWVEELKIAMFCTRSKNLGQLKKARLKKSG